MAEVAGLALGVPGVIDVLIKTCQEGYVFINKACDMDKDFEDYKHQLSVEEQKLKDITTIVATRIQDLTYKIEERRFRLIAKTLLKIAQLFSDFSQLEKLSRIRKVFGLKASKKHTTGNNEHDGSKIGSALTDLELDVKLQIATLKTLETLEPRLRSAYAYSQD
ncbi:hypothetical protein FPQ18DRAFT_384864 [Pyronema domesticum]|nr:hypothetical protein FPQ18DRAFT_384864 [Pyronema domesticum]